MKRLLCPLLFALAMPLARAESFSAGSHQASLTVSGKPGARTFTLQTGVPLRENFPPTGRRDITEAGPNPFIETGSGLLDAYYALALAEARENSVESIRDGAFNHGEPFPLHAFETGRKWPYVWTRDLSYSTHLGLASLDPERCAASLLFKTSTLKDSVAGGFPNQIIQDTGSGGSYPVSSDRVIWALGAAETLKYLAGPARETFLHRAWPILRDTIEQDRALIFDPNDGLYRGEESFLDWREQTYPGWTANNVLPIAMSKALSTCVTHYILLQTGADFAARTSDPERAARYAGWARQLKRAINEQFWDDHAGLYSAFIQNDIRVSRYDLLGQCLAILSGVADRTQASRILQSYPTGPYGPPVVWPQEKSVPIYHNQAIWPFVTAYWLKAARATGNANAAAAALHSLVRGALLNLSNMENFDWVTGLAQADVNGISGPVINSQRQLWSVAAGLSAIQDGLFGLETSPDGIRFQPFVPCATRTGFFPNSTTLRLERFGYRGRTINVTLHLPAAASGTNGALMITDTKLNGRSVGPDFITAPELAADNLFEIWLENPRHAAPSPLREIHDLAGLRNYFGPRQPQWVSPGVRLENGKWVLHFDAAGETNVVFNIYRDGQCVVSNLTATTWQDRDTGRVHYYSVAAMYPESGNVSQLTPVAASLPEGRQETIPAAQMHHQGGTLSDNHGFRNWGKPGDELSAEFAPKESGDFSLSVEYSNGNGPINTGIACGVKRLEIRDDAGRLVAAAPLIMPQTADWDRFLESSPCRARLEAGKTYAIRIFEDATSRNMSYLRNNRSYTANPGGGDLPANAVDVRSLRIIRVR